MNTRRTSFIISLVVAISFVMGCDTSATAPSTPVNLIYQIGFMEYTGSAMLISVCGESGDNYRVISDSTNDRVWSQPVWSPRGNRFVYMGREELIIANSFTGERTPVKAKSNGLYSDGRVSWSPDGGRFAATGSVAPWNLGIFDSLGNMLMIKDVLTDESVQAVFWSPTGDRIALVTQNYTYVIDVNGNLVKRLEDTGYVLGWNSNGTEIVSINLVNGQERIMAATSLEKGSRRIIAPFPNELRAEGYAPPNLNVIILRGMNVIEQYDIATGKLLRQTPVPRKVAWASLRVDGKKYAYMGLEGATLNTGAICVINVDGTEDQILHRAAQAPVWSPRGYSP